MNKGVFLTSVLFRNEYFLHEGINDEALTLKKKHQQKNLIFKLFKILNENEYLISILNTSQPILLQLKYNPT